MAFVRLVFPPMTHLKIEGRHHLEGIDEPVIFIANHNSRLDPVYMVAFLPWRLYFKMMPFRFMTLGKTMRKLRSIPGLYLVGCFPVEPRNGNLESILHGSMKILNRGKNAMVMFPEKDLHKEGEPPHARPGIAYLAKHTGRLVIPVGLSGMREMGAISFWTRKTNVTMKFGKPFYYNDVAKRGEDLREVAQKMMNKVYGLME